MLDDRSERKYRLMRCGERERKKRQADRICGIVVMALLLGSLCSAVLARSATTTTFCSTSNSGGAENGSFYGSNRKRAARRGRMTLASINGDDTTVSRTYTTLEDDRCHDHQRRAQRDVQHVLRTMERAAYLAGDVALSTSGSIEVRNTKANSRDLVTRSDLECQRLIQDVIMKEFPNDEFWGEEDIDDDISGSGSSIVDSDTFIESLDITDESSNEDRLLFIVDPIDGTTNFQAGLPLFAISIGVVSFLSGSSSSKPEVMAGVIYNPALGEMTSAVRNRGCYLNNERIVSTPLGVGVEYRSPRETLLGQSLVNVGFPVCQESALRTSSRAVAALATRVRGLRMIACASQAMSWVAQSKFDSYFSWDLNAWDVAAGMVIIEEAGGLVSNFDGTRADITSRDMIMTCPPKRNGEEDGLLRDEILQVLRDHDCL